jgi:hypothetical protein
VGVGPAAALTSALLLLVAALLAVTGCTTGARTADPAPARSERPTPASTRTPTGTPTRTPTPAETPSASPSRRPRLDSWRVGARPLPLRADGFGQVLPTPRELRVRRLPTRDVLPPPAGPGFRATVGAVTDPVRRRMGRSWSPRCPVTLAELRYVTVTFRGFDGGRHTGELVVNRSVARDLVGVFHRLYDAGYPIEEMRLVTSADLDAAPTGDGNNTAAYVCRTTRGSTTLSAHAYGLAVDVNPFVNPYRKGDLVLPELASAYLDRTWRRPGMIHRGDVVTRAFADIGWTWGGDFTSLSDLMHFSATGR